MRIFSIILFFVILVDVSAQIGINTEKPFSNLLLHIDPLRNTSETAISTQLDDVVVSADGKIGLGTTNPAANLTVNNGTIRIADGTQADNLILTSKSDGSAYWCVDTLDSVVQKLTYTTNISPKTIYDNEIVVKPSSGTSDLSNAIEGAKFDTSNGLFTLPPGYYNISFLPIVSSIYDFFVTNMYLDGSLYMQNTVYTASLGFNTSYESSSSFTISFSYWWNRPLNSNSVYMNSSSYTPVLTINVIIEKISI